MASYNRVVLIGNLTKNIHLKYTPGGLAISEINLAVNDKRKNKDGQWVDDVCYVDVTAFGRTAEVASEYLSKGSPVFIEGKLKLDRWEKDGQKRSKLYVVCDRLQLLGTGGPTKNSDSGDDRPAKATAQVAEMPAAPLTTNNNNNTESSPPAGNPGRGEAAPTGDGAGYDEADIPF